MAFYIIFGSGFLIFGIFQFVKTGKLVKNGLTTTAKITDIKQEENTSQDSEGYITTSYSYIPVFEFNDKDGNVHTVKSRHGFASRNKFKIGDNVDIIYLAEKPDDASIKKAGPLWLLPIITTCLGMIFLVLAFVSK